MKLFKNKKGIASLPAILLLGGIIVEVGIAGAFLLFYLNNSIYGTRLGNEARTVAQAGIDDGIYRVIHNKTLVDSYNLDLGNGTVSVDICSGSCPEIIPLDLNKRQITSIGSVLTRQHRLVSILTIDDTTGLVSIDYIKESIQ